MKPLFLNLPIYKTKYIESSYHTVVNVCVALTNYHILKNPLRKEDGSFYIAVLNGYAKEELEKKRKRAVVNRNYRENQKRQRLNE